MLGKNSVALMPALMPLISLFMFRKSDDDYAVTRNSWDQEYDYIIGELIMTILLLLFR